MFFWLSSLGYYIWKTFRSRNVFLKFTDGTKYCWYSFYAWGSTICMASLGIFAHFFLDITAPKKIFLFDEEPETVGILALSIFFITNAMIIAANIYFFISTRSYLNSRMNASYGRIHYKLKSKWVKMANSSIYLHKCGNSKFMLVLMCLCFQFHYVFVAAVHAVYNMDPINICLVRKRGNVLHEFNNKCNSSATRIIHLRITTRAYHLFVEEVVLFKAATISGWLGRRNDLH